MEANIKLRWKENPNCMNWWNTKKKKGRLRKDWTKEGKISMEKTTERKLKGQTEGRQRRSGSIAKFTYSLLGNLLQKDATALETIWPTAAQQMTPQQHPAPRQPLPDAEGKWRGQLKLEEEEKERDEKEGDEDTDNEEGEKKEVREEWKERKVVNEEDEGCMREVVVRWCTKMMKKKIWRRNMIMMMRRGRGKERRKGEQEEKR